MMTTTITEPGPSVARNGWTTPLWVIAFFIATITLPTASLGVALAAVLTTYKSSARWKRVLIVALGLVVALLQLWMIAPMFGLGYERHDFWEGPAIRVQ